MSEEEALQILDTIPTIGNQVDALEMAIDALEAGYFCTGSGYHALRKLRYGADGSDVELLPVVWSENWMEEEMTVQVNILGAMWTIKDGTEEEYPGLVGCDGYTDSSIRTIVVEKMLDNLDPLVKQDLSSYRKTVMRHEIIHAFLFESGLEGCSADAENWAMNEEMVDWIAIQFPKILEVYRSLNLV